MTSISATCPYCGFKKNIVTYDPLYGLGRQMLVVTCDSDEGGCERDFVVRLYVRLPEFEVLRIEGQETAP